MTQRVQGERKPLAAGFTIAGGALIFLSSIVVWQMMGPELADSMVAGMGVLVNNPFIPSVGIASGALVLFSGIMMYARPQNKRIWGVIAIIFSALAILSLGGFLLGTGLGVIGGILGIANRQV